MMKNRQNSPKMDQEDNSMTKDTRRHMRRVLQICLLILLWVGFPTVHNALAAPQEIVTLSAVQDTYVDLNFASTNFDEGLLTAANSPGPPLEGDVTTKQIYLQFDLSGVEFEIKSAALSLATLTCGGLVPVDAVDVAIYGVDNSSSWDEAELTWGTQPGLSTEALATLDSGGTTYNSAQIYTWTDDKKGEFATWLESQRGANDGSATLVLLIDNSNDPGMADIFFEDSEGTGADYGCTDVLGNPTLFVSDTFASYNLYLPFISR